MKASTAAPRITLFGNFGTGNLGNDATLQAMVVNLRRLLPAAAITCVCPARSSAVLGEIEVIPMRAPIVPWKRRNDRQGGLPAGMTGADDVVEAGWLPRAASLIKRWLRVCVGPLIDMYRWIRGIRALADSDLLIMTGTGMLGDYAIKPLGLHYDIFRWTVIAKLCGCKVLFVSVGSGPVRHPLSRYFVKAALALADYRSYRDSTSKRCLEAIGGSVANDPVYPDLAFSLPTSPACAVDPAVNRGVVVGVGLLNYHDRLGRSVTDDSVYRNYIAQLASFVVQLCDHACHVRLLIGDVVWDQRVIRDLRQELAKRQVRSPENMIGDRPAYSVDDLLDQLAAVDIVVSSRYHNLVLALMLGKPAVAISYHDKFQPLMESVEMNAFCQDIEHIDINGLVRDVLTIRDGRRAFSDRIATAVNRGRLALEEQYDHIARVIRQDRVGNQANLIATLISCLPRG